MFQQKHKLVLIVKFHTKHNNFKENLKLNEETILELKSMGWKQIENQNWTLFVIKGFTNHSTNLPFSLRAFAKVLDWFVNYLGLTYYYHVFEK